MNSGVQTHRTSLLSYSTTDVLKASAPSRPSQSFPPSSPNPTPPTPPPVLHHSHPHSTDKATHPHHLCCFNGTSGAQRQTVMHTFPPNVSPTPSDCPNTEMKLTLFTGVLQHHHHARLPAINHLLTHQPQQHQMPPYTPPNIIS